MPCPSWPDVGFGQCEPYIYNKGFMPQYNQPDSVRKQNSPSVWHHCMFWTKLAAILFCSATLLAAQALPAGTALPIALNSTLNSKQDKAGQKIDGRLMQ